MLSFGDIFPVLFQGGERTGEQSCSDGATGRFYTASSMAMVEEERNLEDFSFLLQHIVKCTVHITRQKLHSMLHSLVRKLSSFEQTV